MRIVYLTAGAAGMYCGSCLHDNALAKALIELGHDAMLVPTYTPILTDESSVSNDRLFFGGLNVYLQQASPVFRWFPKWMDGFLSSPKLVNWVASRAMGTSAKNLGAMTVSMLKGRDGNQRKEVDRLCGWLREQKPDFVLFSNLLIAGCIPELKMQLNCPCVVILQGDDIFYESLEEPYREQAMTELRRLAGQVDLFLAHSQDYGERMGAMLGFAADRLAINPLTLDVSDFKDWEIPSSNRPPTIGYLARLAPEKGLHLLVDAFIELKKRVPPVKLAIAGWLGPQHEEYWQQQREKLRVAGLEDAYRYFGAVDRESKMAFLQNIDVLSVPTTYQEPKGLFVLEGLAAGVPFVQPDHGAFPELHQRLGGGTLFKAGNLDEHVDRLETLVNDQELRKRLGSEARENMLATATTEHEARRLIELLTPLCPPAESY